ncbi:MAG: menaquinone biosynthesis protein [Actinobacteria bacterium]|nr:menaquinone biosynthesis protein [Actinomycetota bacterium]
MRRPRLGHIRFINCMPLYYGMEKREALLDIDLVEANPAELARELLAGALDIAPIPAIEYARHAGEFVLLPDIAISSCGEVQSILLLSKAPAEELSGRTVALADTSRTSQVLTRVLLERRFGVTCTYAEMPPDPAAMLCECDAALLIGDEALKAYWSPPDGVRVYDLGEEWTAWTGLPMVYAVWAVRRSFAEQNAEAAAAVASALNDSLAWCRRHLDEISGHAAMREQLDAGRLRSYFDALHFRFEPNYREGLVRYLSEAVAIGQLERVPVIEVLGE